MSPQDPPADRVLGIRISSLTRRRIDNFKGNRRGVWSLWIFLALFGVSLFAEAIANDRPIFVIYDGAFYFPIVTRYPETTFSSTEFELYRACMARHGQVE